MVVGLHPCKALVRVVPVMDRATGPPVFHLDVIGVAALLAAEVDGF